jgi:hypothetical protein
MARKHPSRRVHDRTRDENRILPAVKRAPVDSRNTKKVWSGVMKSTVLTFACIGVTLAGTLAATNADFVHAARSVRADKGQADTGQADTGLTTSSILPKRERLAVSDTLSDPEHDLVVLAQAEQPTQPVVAEIKQSVVDESALRYFASKGDKARLEAEIARLRTLYPNWVPPADPLAVSLNADAQLEAMWKLYSQSKLVELRKAIADRKASEPGWVPPADLLDRLAVAEKRATLIAASDAGNFADVVTIGAETPALLTCSDIEVLWRVAEAFANTDRAQRADDAYSYILNNCTKAPERLATIQKASVYLTYDRMQTLLSLEKTGPDGIGEFEPIRDDLARRFVAEASKNAEITVAPVYLQRVEQSFNKQAKASDALLLGWYYIARKDMASAGPLFRKAYEIQDTASAAQGLALTLIDKKQPLEAENIMYRWRDSSAEANATYFAATANLLAIEPPPVLDADVLSRMATAVTGKKEVRRAIRLVCDRLPPAEDGSTMVPADTRLEGRPRAGSLWPGRCPAAAEGHGRRQGNPESLGGSLGAHRNDHRTKEEE